MKVFLINLLFILSNVAYSNSSNNVKISIEDTKTNSDYDANDIVMCTNWSWETKSDDIKEISKITLSITPMAAGTANANALYIKNPCNGSGVIELKTFESACTDPVTQQVVNTNGDLVKLTDSFTSYAFSSSCSFSNNINVNSTVEMCSPNKTYVVISCDAGAEFSTENGVLSYGDFFYVDPLANGVAGFFKDDDIDSTTAENTFASIVVSDCDDPITVEGSNFTDSLAVRSNFTWNECLNRGNDCRSDVKTSMIIKRASSWNVSNLQVAPTPTDHGVIFSAPSFISDNLFIQENGYYKNPIFATTDACSAKKNLPSEFEKELVVSEPFDIENNWQNFFTSYWSLDKGGYHINSFNTDNGVGEVYTNLTNFSSSYQDWNRGTFVLRTTNTITLHQTKDTVIEYEPLYTAGGGSQFCQSYLGLSIVTTLSYNKHQYCKYPSGGSTSSQRQWVNRLNGVKVKLVIAPDRTFEYYEGTTLKSSGTLESTWDAGFYVLIFRSTEQWTGSTYFDNIRLYYQ